MSIECFQNNSLEQLFINFANERVQKMTVENLIPFSKTNSNEELNQNGLPEFYLRGELVISKWQLSNCFIHVNLYYQFHTLFLK